MGLREEARAAAAGPSPEEVAEAERALASPNVPDDVASHAAAIIAEASPANGNGRHGVPDTHVYDPEKADYVEPGANPGNLPVQAAPAEPIRRKPTVVQGNALHLTPQQYAVLLRGLDPRRVRQKQGQSHLEAWDIRRTLIRVFGFGGFNIETTRQNLVGERWSHKNNNPNAEIVTVVYSASVRLTIKNPDGSPGAVFEDGATGDAVNFPANKWGDAHDFALKTALSQALKRCAVNLGDMFGLSLYNGGDLTPVVQLTLAGPTIEGGDEVVDQIVESGEVRSEQETPSYLSDPGQHADSDPVTGMPTASALRDEATDPGTSFDRLRAIYSMVNRKRGNHPALGQTEVTNENGDAEPLDYLVWRKLEERKQGQ